jgi:GABA(A) receptor-associated protein
MYGNHSITKPFKNQYTLEERINESNRVLLKYPDRIPIICQRSLRAGKSDLPYIDKIKYLVPKDLTLGQFMYVIRKRLKLESTYALFLFIDGKIPPTTAMLGGIYSTNKDKDGFMYVDYSRENTFG